MLIWLLCLYAYYVYGYYVCLYVKVMLNEYEYVNIIPTFEVKKFENEIIELNFRKKMVKLTLNLSLMFQYQVFKFQNK